MDLDSSNWQRAEGLLPEPVMRRLKSGDYSYRVVDVEGAAFRENYPESFWQKSHANEGRYAVNSETGGLLDANTGKTAEHLQGFPFVTSADSAAACRIVWNMPAADALGVGHGSELWLQGINAGGE